MNIHLFRHGQVAGPAALYGKTDVALSDTGRLALSNATQHLPPPDLIITSPLQRCHAFASQKAEALDCPLKVEADFREMDFGMWDGVPYREDSPEWPAMGQFWQEPAAVTPPDGESLQRMQSRVASAWLATKTQSQETVWIFAHGGTIRLVLAEILGLDWRNPLLYSTLQVGYASRTDISHQHFDGIAMTRVQAIAVPAPLI